MKWFYFAAVYVLFFVATIYSFKDEYVKATYFLGLSIWFKLTLMETDKC